MPGVQLLPSARPHPYAGQNAQAFMKILQTLGQFEGLRQKRMMNTDILSVLSQGGGVEDIAGVVQAHQQPQFDTGARGLFQRIAAPFAEAPGAGITDALLGQAITPEKPLTMSDIRMQEYFKAVDTGDKERADKLLMSSLVSLDFGKPPWWMQGAGKEDAGKFREKQLEGEEAPLTGPQISGYTEAMDTRLDKAKLAWWAGPKNKNRIDYPESELFKQWKIFAGMHKFKNDTQREQIWNVFQNKIKNRAAKGWFSKIFAKGTDFDPTDPKWREAIGLKVPTVEMPGTHAAPGAPPEIPEEVVTKREEVGLRPMELGPEEKAAYKKVLDIWGHLPQSLRLKMMSLRAADFTWEEILTADDLKPYLGE